MQPAFVCVKGARLTRHRALRALSLALSQHHRQRAQRQQSPAALRQPHAAVQENGKRQRPRLDAAAPPPAAPRLDLHARSARARARAPARRAAAPFFLSCSQMRLAKQNDEELQSGTHRWDTVRTRMRCARRQRMTQSSGPTQHNSAPCVSQRAGGQAGRQGEGVVPRDRPQAEQSGRSARVLLIVVVTSKDRDSLVRAVGVPHVVRCVVRLACGKITTHNRVDVAVIHYL